MKTNNVNITLEAVQTYSDLLAKALEREGIEASHHAFTFWVINAIANDISYRQATIMIRKDNKLTNHSFNCLRTVPLIKTEWNSEDIKKARAAFADYFGVEPDVLNYDLKAFEVSGQVGKITLILECDINVNIKGWRVTK
jgi:hypothetical protein